LAILGLEFAFYYHLPVTILVGFILIGVAVLMFIVGLIIVAIKGLQWVLKN
jgi:hypothetical protein